MGEVFGNGVVPTDDDLVWFTIKVPVSKEFLLSTSAIGTEIVTATAERVLTEAIKQWHKFHEGAT